jgi:hypothetical protein
MSAKPSVPSAPWRRARMALWGVLWRHPSGPGFGQRVGLGVTIALRRAVYFVDLRTV